MEKILILDDNKFQLNAIEKQIQKHGYITQSISDSTRVIESMTEFRPDVILVDLMMPNMDGYGVLRQIKSRREFDNTKIVVLSAKDYSYDKKLAINLGADMFLNKVDFQAQICECLRMVIHKEVKVTFWGTRGTVPTPGPGYNKYGGNTLCVGMEMLGNEIIIFDAGTGIIQLGKYLAMQHKKFKIHILITHPHYDHIQGLPFFAPAFMQGNEITVYGPKQADKSIRGVIDGHMDCIYFPITITEFSSRFEFQDVAEGDFKVGDRTCSSLMLLHPGNTLGYKMSVDNKTICYITDNELVAENEAGQDLYSKSKLAHFIKDSDVLIHDTAYMDDEYKSKAGWGHSCLSEVLKLAIKARVKELYLYHHDPAHQDDVVDYMVKLANQYLKKHGIDMKCQAAIERTSFILAKS